MTMEKRRKLLDRKRVWIQKTIHLFIPFYLLCLIGSHLTSPTSASFTHTSTVVGSLTVDPKGQGENIPFEDEASIENNGEIEAVDRKSEDTEQVEKNKEVSDVEDPKENEEDQIQANENSQEDIEGQEGVDSVPEGEQVSEVQEGEEGEVNSDKIQSSDSQKLDSAE